MLALELLQDIHLLLLIRRRQPLLLLVLIKHHLLHHSSGLTVKVRQVRVLGLDLSHVDHWGTGDDVRPPLHLVDLVEVDLDGLGGGRGRGGGEGPGGVFDVDKVREVALFVTR